MAAPRPPDLTFEELLEQSGIPTTHQMAKYFKHIGVIHKSQFALMFKDTDALAVWCNKFKSKITFGDQAIEVTDEDVQLSNDRSPHGHMYTVQRRPRQPTNLTRADRPIGRSTHTPHSFKHSSSGRQSPQDMAPRRIIPEVNPTISRQLRKDTPLPRKDSTRSRQNIRANVARTPQIKELHRRDLRRNHRKRTFTALGTVNSTVKKDKLDKTLTIDTSNNRKTGTPRLRWWFWTHSTPYSGPGYSSNSALKTKWPHTLNVSRHSHAETHTDSQTSKPCGTPSPGK